MKNPARVFLLLFAGLSLAGCASQTATLKGKPKPVALAATWGEQPLSARDYWLAREFDDRIDRARGTK